MNFNATLIGQIFAFAVFIWFCMKFIWPYLHGQMKDREARIADGLAAAEQGQIRLAEAEQKKVELIDEGKQQAGEIISQAQRRGDEIVEEAKSDARAEGDRLLAAARAEIEQERTRAKEQLKTEVSGLALAGAEQILLREVDSKAHKDILDKICAQL